VDSLGERVASKVEGLHLTGTYADSVKSTVKRGVELGKCRLREDPMENSQNEPSTFLFDSFYTRSISVCKKFISL
jgi:hypothetical protein